MDPAIRDSRSGGLSRFHDGYRGGHDQPGQAFRPLTASLQKLMGISKEKMFENTAKRIFYQDKTSKNAEDTNAYSGSVPAKDGACSCHVVWHPSITEDTARNITLSLAPVPE
jgi:hypothetical protein